jgi:hypothetical protein
VKNFVVAPHCDENCGFWACLGVERGGGSLGLESTRSVGLKGHDADPDGRRVGRGLAPGVSGRKEAQRDGESGAGKDRSHGHPHGDPSG